VVTKSFAFVTVVVVTLMLMVSSSVQADTMFSEFTVCTASGAQTKPVIDGNIVVWEDRRNANNYDIYAKEPANRRGVPRRHRVAHPSHPRH
jgi:beta propeller repeat protein